MAPTRQGSGILPGALSRWGHPIACRQRRRRQSRSRSFAAQPHQGRLPAAADRAFVDREQLGDLALPPALGEDLADHLVLFGRQAGHAFVEGGPPFQFGRIVRPVRRLRRGRQAVGVQTAGLVGAVAVRTESLTLPSSRADLLSPAKTRPVDSPNEPLPSGQHLASACSRKNRSIARQVCARTPELWVNTAAISRN